MRKIACAFSRIKANSKNQTYPIHTHLRPIFAYYFGNIAVKCYQSSKNVTKLMKMLPITGFSRLFMIKIEIKSKKKNIKQNKQAKNHGNNRYAAR